MANKAIVGQKVGMTQVWDDNNRVVPVTVVKVQPCRVVQIKTPETDGYSALQVTFGSKDPRKLTQPVAGHYDKAGVAPGVKLVELLSPSSSPRHPRPRAREGRRPPPASRRPAHRVKPLMLL